jgi:hypothetical protein
VFVIEKVMIDAGPISLDRPGLFLENDLRMGLVGWGGSA